MFLNAKLAERKYPDIYFNLLYSLSLTNLSPIFTYPISNIMYTFTCDNDEHN